MCSSDENEGLRGYIRFVHQMKVKGYGGTSDL